MDKQERYDRTYLNMANEWAKLSHCSVFFNKAHQTFNGNIGG